MENKTFWEKLNSNAPLNYNDIENYIYTKEYIEALNNNDYNFNGRRYNNKLHMYFFEVEEYDSEADYQEVFFQNYLDKNISKEYYIYYEDKFIKMMEILFNISETFVYYTLEISLDNNNPAQNSKDVLKDFETIKFNSNKFICVEDWYFFKQVCCMSAREIDCVCYVFTDIQAVLINSGMHGYIFFNEPLKKELQDELSNIINLNIVTKK